MIFVTVGSAEKGMEFDRLIRKADELAAKIPVPFTLQIGSSSYAVKNAAFFSYAPFHEMLGYFQKARLVIAHCGSGVVLNAVRFGVPIIVVPRLVAFREHDLDDHQLHLARKLEGKKGIYTVLDVEDLEAAVHRALEAGERPNARDFEEVREPLLKAVGDFLSAVS